ncbi:MAG: purine nucleoside permease [Acidobacteriota bacterium]
MKAWFGMFVIALCAALVSACSAPAETSLEPTSIRVVVVTMFERGEATGDSPGELQLWAERFPFTETLDFPQGYRELLYDPRGVLAMVTGVGTARSAASVMALGMDPRFDLSKAYWLVAGIAGIDPEDASVGSAAWARYVVDGDLAHQIDLREAPEGWPTGYIPLRKATPYELPLQEDTEGSVYELNVGLRDWAYALTRDVDLGDSEELQDVRSRYPDFPAALEPPRVLLGDNLAAMTFWHGALLNDWANDWTAYFTEGAGNFVTSAMEDTGTLQAIDFLERAGRARRDRVMVLRSGSNFTMQPDGATAAESLAGEKKGSYSAYLPSLEALWRVGSPVVEELLAGWEVFEISTPSAELDE